jgi:molecular chaperone GrpE (heat shock protein)
MGMSKADMYSEQPDLTPDESDCLPQLEQAQQKAADYKDKYLRAAAQAENIRKWTERDIQARATEEKRVLLSRLLEVADNLNRALEDQTGRSNRRISTTGCGANFEAVRKSLITRRC